MNRILSPANAMHHRSLSRPRFPLIAALVGFASLPSLALAQPGISEYLRSNPKLAELFVGALDNARKSTVRVLSNGREAALGVVVSDDGFVLTKAYDLKGKLSVRLPDGKDYPASWVGHHEKHDLAMLKIDAKGLKPATFAASRGTAAGAWVASPGLSKQPLAIGVVSVPTRTINFKGIPDVLLRDPNKTGYLGVMMEQAEGGGVVVTNVDPNTPAAKAGIKKDDVVKAVNGVDVAGPKEMQQQIIKHKPGDKVRVLVERKGDFHEIEATLGPRPAGGSARSDLQNRMGSELSSRRNGYPSILQHDSVIRPNECGGPICDIDGRILGINISRAGRVETWAVPSETIQALLGDLKTGKLAPPVHAVAKLDLSPDNLKHEAELIVNAIKARLDLMPAVAKTKYSRKKDIRDAKREADLLDGLSSRASEIGLSRDQVKAFFQAQFDAGRLMQKNLFDLWDAGKGPEITGSADLVRTLRPKIDEASLNLLVALSRAEPYLTEATFQKTLQEVANRLLTGDGVDDSIRRRVLAPLATRTSSK